ncbi:MAG: S-adenosylmethionine decarboxylase [Thermus sp.]|nr:S-adenosylmethionine decarboxylase [Thermus sp.]
MEAVPGGRWVAEIYGCDLDVLENPKMVEAALLDAVLRLGAPKDAARAVVYKFQPQGLSAAVVSPVAAVMIHTWPEDNASATLDLYFYRDGVDPEEVLKGLSRAFGAKEESAFRYWRGTEYAIRRRAFGSQKEGG